MMFLTPGPFILSSFTEYSSKNAMICDAGISCRNACTILSLVIRNATILGSFACVSLSPSPYAHFHKLCHNLQREFILLQWTQCVHLEVALDHQLQ